LTLSGYGQNLVNAYLVDFIASYSADTTLADVHNGPFSESTCRDMTLEGIDKLQEDYDTPLFVIALGLSADSEIVHQKIIERLQDGFLYERIDYLQGPLEGDHSYNERITLDARRIARLLVNNASLQNPDEEKEENLIIDDFTCTSDISGTTSTEATTPIIQNLSSTKKSSFAQNLTSSPVDT